MQSFPSRSERRQARFLYRAQKGLFTCEETLYKTEVKKLLRDGFSILKVTENEFKQGLGLYIVSWEHPYETSVPQEVEEYIMGIYDYPGEYPFEKVKTIAQSLYITAAKFSHQL